MSGQTEQSEERTSVKKTMDERKDLQANKLRRQGQSQKQTRK